MPLLPLHIVTSFYWDEFLVLLVPTTIVLFVGLEKLRLRGQGGAGGEGPTEPEADEGAPQFAAIAAGPPRAAPRRRAKRRR